MILPADYHMHTPLCQHATGEPTQYAAHAERIGLEEIGFSDHSPMPRDHFDNWRMSLTQLDSYVAAVNQAKAEHPHLKIKIALEVDYLPGQEDWIRELSTRHSWDYLIGSVHYVTDSWDIDNPARLEEWQRHDREWVWNTYLERLAGAAGSGLFDILGHLDLPKKFRFYPRGDILPGFDRVLEIAAEKGVAIELNTAGLRKDCQEIYPSRAILEIACRRGVPITFGSDAHAPDDVGRDFESAVELARSVGYRAGRRFEQRRAETVPLSI